mmetsp:Transcript_40589/g.131390  ORF Transcript_40589/g.131390 Transcript_40589/m.131390 type:complete len:215 (-) Transcript_40589:66-710(-)
MKLAFFLLAVFAGVAAYSPDVVVSDQEEAAALAPPEPRPAWLEYWVPSGVPVEFGAFAKLSEANSTCVLLPNATQGSLWGEGVYDGNGTLVNGTYCEPCSLLPGLEAPLMTSGLPCRTIYLSLAVLLFLLLLVIAQSQSGGGAGSPTKSRAYTQLDASKAAPPPSPRDYIAQVRKDSKEGKAVPPAKKWGQVQPPTRLASAPGLGTQSSGTKLY